MWLYLESRSGEGTDAELVGALINQPLATHSRLVPGRGSGSEPAT
jgi:hypothetical protein